LDSKKHINKKQIAKNFDSLTIERIAKIFSDKGLTNTSKWITHAIETKLPDPQKDRDDILNSLKNEIRTYRNIFYKDSSFRENCFKNILSTILRAIIIDPIKFTRITKKLHPLIGTIVQTNIVLGEIVKIANELEQKPRFFMICFYYLILLEGSFKNVKLNLSAMERLTKEGKEIEVTETGGVRFGEKIEDRKNVKYVLPECLEKGIHSHLRNAIAHARFRYIDKENKMKFWDVHPQNHIFTMDPIKLNYKEFSKYLLQVNLFCEIFGFINLTLIALEDISKRYS
jgi:hypothetical protein